MDRISINKDLFLERYKPKSDLVNKSSAGKLLITAGSGNFLGAAALSTLAALRSGCGFVTLATTKQVVDHVFPLAVEATYNYLCENSSGRLASSNSNTILGLSSQYHSLLLGCGLGLDEDTKQLVNSLVLGWDKPMVLDADGINAVKDNLKALADSKASIIITPHPGEMARLINSTAEYVVENRYKVAKDFSKKYNVIVVLKGYETVISNGSEVYVWHLPNSGMAKAGSGDVLAGIIGSLNAQGLSAMDSAICGVFLHGFSGSLASVKYSKQFMQPRNVIDSLSSSFKQLNECKQHSSNITGTL